MGANSSKLRLDAAERGASQTRYATVERLKWVNRVHGRVSTPPLRGVNPVTNVKPQGIQVADFKATAVPLSTTRTARASSLAARRRARSRSRPATRCTTSMATRSRTGAS